jgi:hypothetical protein
MVSDEERRLEKKSRHMRRFARSHFECCCLHKDVKNNSDEQDAIFSHELQIALRLTVGFSDISCEL